MYDKPTYEELEQRVRELEREAVSGPKKIKVSDINIKWNVKKGLCTFEDLPVAMMWIDTTLAGLMSGVQAMVGRERFGLALQGEGRKSVEDDWKVISQFADFKEGFKAIANIAAVAGWGGWRLISLDEKKQECQFQVWDSWEGLYQKSIGVYWGSGMLAGKMAGYCTKLFSTNCWADQTKFIAKGDEFDEFVVKPSDRSIEKEIETLLATDEATRADMAVALLKLQKEVNVRIRAEEALRESEARFKDLASFLPLSLFETDDQGNVTFANPFAFKTTGYNQEDIDKGLHMLQVIHPEGHDKAIKMSMRVMQGEHTDGSEHLMQRKDGSTFRAFINTNPTIKDGKTIGLKGYIFNLTKQKRAEKALRESEEKLARSKKMESLGLLAGGVAHDLNNVLSGIVSYPELILLDLPEDSKLRKPIETMQESGHRAAAIVQDLLTVARGVATTKKPLSLNDLIGDYLYSPEFKQIEQYYPTVTIKTNLDTDLLKIAGSHIHIRKVIMNLVSNASEAVEGSGNVTISTINRYIDRPLRGYDDVSIGEYVVLAVSDDGSGISSDDLERIFEPFYTKKVMGRSGTGLGLAVVWNVVQDHKGYIDVTTDENGTTFELYFPITREEIPDKNLSIPIKDLKGDGEMILVVDDVASQREISCKMLDTLGYKTKAVSSGEEAVEYLKEHTIDLILLDMIMEPGMNGREAYEQIIKIHPNQKAIIASGFAETDDVKEAQNLGAGQYIKKPLTLEKIGIAVREELKK